MLGAYGLNQNEGQRRFPVGVNGVLTERRIMVPALIGLAVRHWQGRLRRCGIAGLPPIKLSNGCETRIIILVVNVYSLCYSIIDLYCTFSSSTLKEK